jgi:hypothetical protein
MTEVYQASPIKPFRPRATAAEMEDCARFLIDYAARHGPVTVRQLYYRAEVEGLPGLDKTDSSYDKIQRQVLLLRRAGRLPHSDIADLTRWMRKPRTFDSVEEALQETARLYRKALWRGAEVTVEIWCEKDALAGVIYPVTELYDVPLMVARGYSSLFTDIRPMSDGASFSLLILLTEASYDGRRGDSDARSGPIS